MSASATDGTGEGLSDEALRWLRAPRPAGKPLAPTVAPTESAVPEEAIQ